MAMKFSSKQHKYSTVNPKGFLVRAYTCMQRRIRKHPSYDGLPICTRKQFYDRFLTDPDFLRLHAAWVASGECRRKPLKTLRPVPDRKNGWRGYDIDNLQFITYRANNLRPNRNTHKFFDGPCPTCESEPCDCEYRRPLAGAKR